MSKLSGKVALITGSGSGIGRATALLFAKEGAKVVVVDLNLSGAQETVRLIKESGGEAIAVKADVTKSSDVQNAINTCLRQYGKLDILFNNAGIEQIPAAIADISEETWDKVITVDLKGVFLCMKYGIQTMLKMGGGVIISTASTGGLVAFPQTGAYATAKSGVISLTKTAAMEYADKNIRVNCICPGVIDTPLVERLRSSAEWQSSNPLRSPYAIDRKGKPEEIAQGALYLASDESSSWVTGTALVIDGGYTAL